MLTNHEDDVVAGLLRHGFSILDYVNLDKDTAICYHNRINKEKLDYPTLSDHVDRDWLIPDTYKTLDIHSWLLEQCSSYEQELRVAEELVLFEEYDMIMVLRAMKYVVDTCRKHEILWGVGRGSSVASYCLFLIGVHKIDSIKYEIPINEFFKKE